MGNAAIEAAKAEHEKIVGELQERIQENEARITELSEDLHEKNMVLTQQQEVAKVKRRTIASLMKNLRAHRDVHRHVENGTKIRAIILTPDVVRIKLNAADNLGSMDILDAQTVVDIQGYREALQRAVQTAGPLVVILNVVGDVKGNFVDARLGEITPSKFWWDHLRPSIVGQRAASPVIVIAAQYHGIIFARDLQILAEKDRCPRDVVFYGVSLGHSSVEDDSPFVQAMLDHGEHLELVSYVESLHGVIEAMSSSSA
eukprot:GILK01004049.1.p1 GENE.GILK01004049.1~~GILK01004049.1.p1  ORF type:complete len:272 (+),score=51.70 GILK01004049.1:44-817(+)